MRTKRTKTQYPGVYAKEHPTRKTRGGQKDKYYTIRYSRARKQIEEGIGWSSEGWNAQKAHALLSEIKQGIKSGDGPQSLQEKREEKAKCLDQEKVTKMTLDVAFSEHILPMLQRQKASWLTDLQRYKKIISPAIGGHDTHSIATHHVQSIVDYLIDIGMAPATVRQYRGLVHSIFERLRSVQVNGQAFFTGENPVRNVKTPPVVNARERWLTGDEAQRLIVAAKAKKYPALLDAIVLALNTGMRLGEIQRLEWVDVDLECGFVHVKKEAHRKPGGTIPLNPAAQQIFVDRKKRTRKEKPQGLVFPPHLRGEKRGNITYAFRQLVDELGFNDGIPAEDRSRRVVFHSLRHTFASWMAMQGLDIFRIKTLMRHKNINMTMRYAHLIPDATREAVDALKPPDSPRVTSQD